MEGWWGWCGLGLPRVGVYWALRLRMGWAAQGVVFLYGTGGGCVLGGCGLWGGQGAVVMHRAGGLQTGMGRRWVCVYLGFR